MLERVVREVRMISRERCLRFMMVFWFLFDEMFLWVDIGFRGLEVCYFENVVFVWFFEVFVVVCCVGIVGFCVFFVD